MKCRQKRSNLERREEELRKARAAIRRAVKFKNYTSNEKVIYIPTGQIYRNSFAFHQLSQYQTPLIEHATHLKLEITKTNSTDLREVCQDIIFCVMFYKNIIKI